MANPSRQNKADIEKSEQEILNESFDREFNVLAFQSLVHDPRTNTLVRAVDYRQSNVITAVCTTATDSGDTTIYTPTSGKAIRLFFVYAMNDPDQSTSPLIKISLGSTELYRGFAVSHTQLFEGAANEVLKINLDGAASVAVTAHIQEFTP